MPTSHLLDIGPKPQSHAAEQAGAEATGLEQAGRRESRDHVLRTGQRRGPQQQAELAAETATVDEHEPLAQLGELVGELHRDAAAEGVPHEGRAVVPERREQVAQAARGGAKRVVPAGLRGRAVTGQVGREDREAPGKVGHDPPPVRRV